MTLRILIADDHPVVRAGVRALLEDVAELEIVAEAADGVEAVDLYAAHLPDVAVLDLRMPKMGGIEAIRAIVAAHPRARIVVLTLYEGDTDIFRALDAGACGYLTKDTAGTDLVGAIFAAAGGRRAIPAAVAQRLAAFTPRVDLTSRELEVLTLVASGASNKRVAHALGRTEATVKAHLKHMMAKLGTADRTETVRVALDRGIIHLAD